MAKTPAECIFLSIQLQSKPDPYSLTSDEAAAIYLFTMEFRDSPSVHAILNMVLRSRDRTQATPLLPLLRLLLGGIRKLPHTRKTVYRALLGNSSAHYKPGDKVFESIRADVTESCGIIILFRYYFNINNICLSVNHFTIASLQKVTWWGFSATTGNANVISGPLLLGDSGPRGRGKSTKLMYVCQNVPKVMERDWPKAIIKNPLES